MKFLTLGLLFLILPITLTAQTYVTIISVQSNIRKSASADSDVVKTVKQGAKLKLVSLEHYNGWYNVQSDKTKGWIHGNNIEFSESKRSSRKSEDNWILYATSSDSYLYYNSGRLTRNGSIVRVWSKSVSKESYEKDSMIQYEVNCAAEKFRSIAGVSYYSDGSVSQNWDRPRSGFSVIIPETVIEGLFKKLCR